MWWILTDPLFIGINLFISLVYYYGTNTFDYWKKRNVPYLKPKYPFFGSLFDTIFFNKSTKAFIQEIYEQFNEERFCGIFTFRNPTLFVRDPSLIDTILIKEFISFCNRGSGGDIDFDPISGSLVHLEHQQWKSLRQKLTPTFSSGKIKGMFQQVIDCTDTLIKYIDKCLTCENSLEFREIGARFTTDIVGSCVFGVNADAINNPESEFRKMGEKIFNSMFKNKLRLTIKSNYPKLMKFLRWKSVEDSVEIFFSSLLQKTMSYREKNNIVRKDFVQLLMELKRQDQAKENLTVGRQDEEIIVNDKIIFGNSVIFFLAGFETTSTTLGYCLYELALNQEIQEKAYREIISVIGTHGGALTYEALTDLPLIDNIMSETLRLHPPLVDLKRKATKDYKVPGSSLLLQKGTMITIPVYSLHHDPKYFPEPKKFKPERFDKKQHNIIKGTYLPFGDGPRLCIGSRFANMVVQTALIKLLLTYKFKPNLKTSIPIVYNSKGFSLVPANGMWLDLHKRT